MEKILHIANSDSRLAGLFDEARDCAHIYVLARQRQKGCAGMGELAMIKE